MKQRLRPILILLEVFCAAIFVCCVIIAAAHGLAAHPFLARVAVSMFLAMIVLIVLNWGTSTLKRGANAVRFPYGNHEGTGSDRGED